MVFYYYYYCYLKFIWFCYFFGCLHIFNILCNFGLLTAFCVGTSKCYEQKKNHKTKLCRSLVCVCKKYKITNRPYWTKALWVLNVISWFDTEETVLEQLNSWLGRRRWTLWQKNSVSNAHPSSWIPQDGMNGNKLTIGSDGLQSSLCSVHTGTYL